MSVIQAYYDTPLNQQYELAVDDIHRLHVEECGNPLGIPVLFLHGGPGGSIGPSSRIFFDPSQYRIILFDQRGTGQSRPFLCLENNTVDHSVEDIEVIRQYLGIDRWIVFGGSYGSTLALAYAIMHADRVLHLVLRGIFLGRTSDIHWLFQEGASYFYPDTFQCFKDHVPTAQQDDLVSAYYQLMSSGDEAVRDAACLAWSNWENSCITLMPQHTPHTEPTAGDISCALLENFYFYHRMFWSDDQYILSHADRLASVPMVIVHGRYDVDCRPSGAYDLKQACPHAKLYLVEGGAHAGYEGPMLEQLVRVMDQLAHDYQAYQKGDHRHV